MIRDEVALTAHLLTSKVQRKKCKIEEKRRLVPKRIVEFDRVVLIHLLH